MYLNFKAYNLNSKTIQSFTSNEIQKKKKSLIVHIEFKYYLTSQINILQIWTPEKMLIYFLLRTKQFFFFAHQRSNTSIFVCIFWTYKFLNHFAAAHRAKFNLFMSSKSWSQSAFVLANVDSTLKNMRSKQINLVNIAKIINKKF